MDIKQKGPKGPSTRSATLHMAGGMRCDVTTDRIAAVEGDNDNDEVMRFCAGARLESAAAPGLSRGFIASN